MRLAVTIVFLLFLSIQSCKKAEVTCDGTTRTYDADIKAIIDANCVDCHSEYSNYSGVKASVDNGSFRNEVITKQSMPRNSKLSDSDLTKIKCWLEQGAPEN